MFAENALKIISRTQAILKVGGCDMKYGLVLLLGALLAVVFVSGEVRAESTSSWVDEPFTVLQEVSEVTPSPSELSCAGSNSRIQMAGENALRAACVYGVSGKPRLARVVNYAGQFEYAMSFTNERYFYTIEHLCLGLDRCVYSQAEDSLLHQALLPDGSYTYRLVRQFSKQIERVAGETVSYRIRGMEGDLLLDGLSMTTLALSSNGKWAAIEVPRKGIVRLNFKTGGAIWVASLSVVGASPQPILGLAVSRDGRWVASTGWYKGLTVYEVREPCGVTSNLSDVVQWCAASTSTKTDVFPGYVRAYRPVFSSDGLRLSVFLVRQQGSGRVTVAPMSRARSAGSQYIALGDSYTSGEGELADSFYLPGTNTDTNRCHVSVRSYPLLLGEGWGMAATNAACSGSRITDARAKLAELSDTQPLLVSIGIGGNDVDLVGKLKTCLGLGTCEWAKEGVRLASAQEMQRILPDIVQLIEEVKLSTGAAVFVVGYPSIFASDTVQCDALTASLLSIEERTYVEASIQYLNTILQSAARYAEATYVDVSQAFTGERLCEGSQKGMNAVRVGDDIAPLSFIKEMKFIGAESFHPTPFGHQKIAEAIRTSYTSFWLPRDCQSCDGSAGYTSYWLEGVADMNTRITQSAVRFMTGELFRAGESTPFSIPPGTFSPGSPVRVEIRSAPQTLAEYSANEDGSLGGEVTFPEGVEGYHTVHVIGTSQSGEVIDVYQILYVQPVEKVISGSATAIGNARVEYESGPVVGISSIGLTQKEVSDSMRQGVATEVLGARHQGVHRSPNFGILIAVATLGFLALLVLIFLLLFRRKV